MTTTKKKLMKWAYTGLGPEYFNCTQQVGPRPIIHSYGEVIVGTCDLNMVIELWMTNDGDVA